LIPIPFPIHLPLSISLTFLLSSSNSLNPLSLFDPLLLYLLPISFTPQNSRRAISYCLLKTVNVAWIKIGNLERELDLKSTGESSAMLFHSDDHSEKQQKLRMKVRAKVERGSERRNRRSGKKRGSQRGWMRRREPLLTVLEYL